MENIVKARFKQRADTAANWTATNPTLASAEIGVETDTGKFKIGDGKTAWKTLGYKGEVTVDSSLSGTSTNPVQNKVINSALNDKANKSTTLAGYGITDIKIADGTITIGSSSIKPITAHQDISGKANKATTLSGYGITDAKISNGVITLGSNTITPLTSHQSLTDYAKKSTTLAGYGITNAYTKTEVDNKVSAIPKFAISVVSALPTSDISATTIYLLKTGDESQNLYTEYIYVNSAWEKLGTQKLDLSGYVTKETADATYLGKTDTAVNASKVNNLTVQTAVPANAKFTDTTYNDLKGATASAAGTHGLVPAPKAGEQNKFLRADGTWQNAGNNTVYISTTQSDNPLVWLEIEGGAVVRIEGNAWISTDINENALTYLEIK